MNSFDPDPGSDPVVIVGAGAAGLTTAIFARRFNGARAVVLLDGAKTPGAKILVSGGTRCNVTNTVVTEHDFWGGSPAVIRRVLRAFPVADTIAFFRGIGVPLHEEAGGKLFPDSNRARDVLTALLDEAAAVGVRLLNEHRVLDVRRRDDRLTVVTSRGEIAAAIVVLATGGLSLPKSGSDGAGLGIAGRLGHRIVETTPALAPLTVDASGDMHRSLSGVAQEVELAIWVDGSVAVRIRGAMLWTHFGVSGPAALDASRHLARARIEGRAAAITVNFRPGQEFADADRALVDQARDHPRAMIQTTLASALPGSVAGALMQACRVDGATTLAHLGRDDRRRIARALVEWPLPVSGTRGYSFAEATAGGVSLDEIDPATMASRKCPGLFLVGEVLDVDGRLGGFNFQWAWSTGFVAGRALAACHG